MKQAVILEAKDQVAWFECSCQIRFEDTLGLRDTPNATNPYFQERDDFIYQMTRYENRLAIGSRTIELTPEGTKEEVAGFSFTSKWMDLVFWIRTDEHIFIVHATLNAHIIPLRSFEGAEQEGPFVDCLKSTLKERSLTRR